MSPSFFMGYILYQNLGGGDIFPVPLRGDIIPVRRHLFIKRLRLLPMHGIFFAVAHEGGGTLKKEYSVREYMGERPRKIHLRV